MILLATPEGEEAIKAEMERSARVLRWAGVAVGTQASLFGEDRTPITERAFAEGRRAGLLGESHNNAYHVTNDGHAEYNAGYIEGQAALATKGFKPLTEDESADVKKAAALGTTRPTYEMN